MNALQSQVQQQLKKQFAFLDDPSLSGTPTPKQVDNMEKAYGNPKTQRLSDKAREANLEAFNANLTENARQTGQAFMQNTAGRPIEERYEMQKEAQNAFKAQLSHLSEEQQQLALDTFNAETDVLKQADNEAGVIARTGDLLSYIPSTATKFGEQLTGLFSPDGDWRKWFTDATKEVESWRSDESKLRNYINAQNLAQAKANGESGFTQYLANAIDAPLETIGQFAESAIPTIASGVIGTAAAPFTGGASLALPLAVSGVQGAGEARNNIYDHIMAMPETQLAQSPEYQALLAQGLSSAQARNELASSLTEHGGEVLSAGVSSAILNKLGGLGRIGQAGKGVLGSTTGKFVSEAVTEPADEVFQQLMVNKAIRDIDPTHSLSENLGEAAAGGLLFGVAGGGVAAADNAFRTEKTAEQAEEPVVNPESPKQSDQEQPTATPINSQALDEALKPYQDSEDYAEMRADLERDIQDGVIEERAKSNSQYGKLAQAYLNATGQGQNQGQATAEAQAESNTQAVENTQNVANPPDNFITQASKEAFKKYEGELNALVSDVSEGKITAEEFEQRKNAIIEAVSKEATQNVTQHQDFVPYVKEKAQAHNKSTQDQAEAELQQTANTAPTAPRNVLTGSQDSVDVGENDYQPFQYEVMEADDLAPTQQKAGNQLRDRERTASQAQVNKIARNLDPRKVADSPTMDFGAPLLAQDGKTVIAGNGRSMAIRQAYAEGNADNYRQYLQQNAAKFGVDGEQLAAMKNPVLVRRLNTAVDIKQTAINSNEQGGMRMSNLEQAKVDAQRLPNMAGFELDESGNLNTPNNRSFISQFIQNQPENLRNELLDKEGKLSQTGVQRLRNAMLYQAYGDTDTLARAVESTDQGARNIINALTRIAPKVAQVKQDIANGDVNDVDISSDIVQAVEKYNQLKNQNQDVGEYLQQQDFVSELSPEAKSVLRIFNENHRSAKRIGDILTSYYQTAETQGNAAQSSMFGEEAFDKAGTLEQAKNAELEDNTRFSLNENSDSPFAKAVDSVMNGRVRGKFVQMGTTPDVLKMLGLPDTAISIRDSVIEKAVAQRLDSTVEQYEHPHNLTAEDLKKLPAQINNPIAVMKSASTSTNPNGFVVLTELFEQEGEMQKPVIAALRLRQTAKGLEVINISSVHGRPVSQIKNFLMGDLLYWNKAKGYPFADSVGLQLPRRFSADNLSARNVKTETDLSQYQNPQSEQNTNTESNDAEQTHARELLRRALGEHADKIELVRDEQFGENDARRGAEGWYHNGKLYLNLDGITDGNILNKDERLVWVAWHELGHHGVEVQLSHALKNQLRQARKNVVVNGIANRIFAERRAEAKRENNPSLEISQEVATEEAIVELFAAVETGNWAEIESRYNVKIKESWRSPQGDLAKRLSYLANFFKRLVARITGKNLDTVSNQEVLDLLATVKQGIAKSAENSTASDTRYSLSEESDSDFAKAVDAIAEGENPISPRITLGTTPDVLKMLGIADANVVMNVRTLRKDMVRKHRVSPEAMKQLPQQMNNPVAVMSSQSTSSNPDAYLVLTELVEQEKGKDKPVIAALSFEKNANGDLELLGVASVYGRRPSQINNDLSNVMYWNTKKGEQLIKNFSLLETDETASLRTSLLNADRLSDLDIKTETDLSQYQSENSEVRYSRKAPKQDTPYQRDLMVTHNISAKGIMHAKKMGGLPFASVAVAKQSNPLTGFGEVTLIGDRDYIDPKGANKAKVFGADVYSPRHSGLGITYRINAKDVNALNKQFEESAKAIGDNKFSYDFSYQGLEDKGVVNTLENSTAVKYQFLKENGVAVEPVYDAPVEVANNQMNYPSIQQAKAQGISRSAFVNNDELLTRFVEDHIADLSERLEKAEKMGNPLVLNHAKRNLSVAQKILESGIESIRHHYRMKILDLKYDEETQAAPRLNAGKTATKINELVEERASDFADYVDNIANSIDVEERIDDGEARDGTRKTIPHNLENVVKKLKQNIRGGEKFGIGQGNVRAKVTPQFDSIADIQDNKHRIVSADEFENVRSELEAEAQALGNEFNTSDIYDLLWNAAEEGIPQAFHYADVKNTARNRKLVQDYLDKLEAMPTEYFEGKAKDVTQFSDFSGAVIPNNLPKNAYDVLQQAGLKIYEYDPDVATSRAEIIKQATNELDEQSGGNILFSRKQTSMEILTDGKVKHETLWGTIKAGEFGKIWNEVQRKTDFALTDETLPVLDWIGDLELDQVQENALKADFELADGVRHSLNSQLMQRFLKPLHKNIVNLAKKRKKDIEWTKKPLVFGPLRTIRSRKTKNCWLVMSRQ